MLAELASLAQQYPEANIAQVCATDLRGLACQALTPVAAPQGLQAQPAGPRDS